MSLLLLRGGTLLWVGLKNDALERARWRSCRPRPLVQRPFGARHRMLEIER